MIPQQYPATVVLQSPLGGDQEVTWRAFCKMVSLKRAQAVLSQWERAQKKSPLMGGQVMFSIGPSIGVRDYWIMQEIHYVDSKANPKSPQQKTIEAHWARLKRALSYKVF
jgi:hypothetical protein